MASISCVYTITNIINSKIYVGFSYDFKERQSSHLSQLRKNKHMNKHLQNAFNLDGEDNFIFEILEEYDRKLLPAMEHFWAILLDTHQREFGYNFRPTHPYGKSSQLEETKRKISLKQKGKKVSPETKEKIRIARARQVFSKEHKRKISESSKGRPHPMKGKKMDPEIVKKRSKIMKQKAEERGYWLSESTIKKIVEKNKERSKKKEVAIGKLY